MNGSMRPHVCPTQVVAVGKDADGCAVVTVVEETATELTLGAPPQRTTGAAINAEDLARVLEWMGVYVLRAFQ